MWTSFYCNISLFLHCKNWLSNRTLTSFLVCFVVGIIYDSLHWLIDWFVGFECWISVVLVDWSIDWLIDWFSVLKVFLMVFTQFPCRSSTFWWWWRAGRSSVMFGTCLRCGGKKGRTRRCLRPVWRTRSPTRAAWSNSTGMASWNGRTWKKSGRKSSRRCLASGSSLSEQKRAGTTNSREERNIPQSSSTSRLILFVVLFCLSAGKDCTLLPWIAADFDLELFEEEKCTFHGKISSPGTCWHVPFYFSSLSSLRTIDAFHVWCLMQNCWFLG